MGEHTEEHKEEPKEQHHEEPREIKVEKEKVSFLEKIKNFYDFHYKLLLAIPFLLLSFSIVCIGLQYASTGDVINRDVSLKGGLTLTITSDENVDISYLESRLKEAFPENDIEVRALTKFGSQAGIIIAADIEEKEVDSKLSILLEETGKVLEKKLTAADYSLETVGSSLGASFFKEIVRALLIAFFFMGAVVFFYFGPDLKLKIITSTLAVVSSIIMFMNQGVLLDIIAYLMGAALIYIFIRYSIPSFAVILASLSNIIVTLAIVNFLNIKLSTAGIAAFLMLIGYSVDTDILLSTKVLKRKDGTILERIFAAMKTGFTMTLTTLAAVTVALLFTQSEIIKQIMIILLIGLFIDLINTWIQNAGILRLYLERKQKVR